MRGARLAEGSCRGSWDMKEATNLGACAAGGCLGSRHNERKISCQCKA